MDPVTFVEVLGRRGDVVQRVRLERLPATIGRGYGCDVIVSDPLVDPVHARLARDEQGALVLEDLGSRNGLFLAGTQRRVDRIPVAGVTLVRVGRTQLRIVPADAALAPALPDTESGGRLTLVLASPRAALAIALAGFACAMLMFWLGTYEKRPVIMGAGGAMVLAVLAGAWAGVWALIGRANVQRFSFWPHYTAAWLFLIALSIVGALGSYGVFLFPGSAAAAIAPFAVVALWIALVARHLGLATLMPRPRRLGMASISAGVLLALGLVAGRLATDHGAAGSTIPIAAALKPMPARLVPGAGLERFLKATSDLKRELDRLKDEE